MSRIIASTALLFAFFANICWSQPEEVDTTAAWRYYPIATGNVWEYQGYGMDPGDRRVWIERDTMISERRYFIEALSVSTESDTVFTTIIRFDTTLASVVSVGPDGSEKIVQSPGCPLDAPFGAVVSCSGRGAEYPVSGGHGRSFEFLDGSTIDGITIKEFGNGYGGGWSYIAGIGYAGAELVFEYGGKRLAYARIDGVEYGTLLNVGTETPDEPALGAVSAYPNPARNALNVDLRIARSGHFLIVMYDLLGRKVRRFYDGPLTPGESPFTFDVSEVASGAYIIVVEGMTAVRDARIIVVE